MRRFLCEKNMTKRWVLALSMQLVALSFVFAQNTIRGKVVEAGTNEALPGVSIQIKEQTKGTITDFDGNYTLDGVSNDAVLIFSFIGFKQQEVSINGRSIINVDLELDLTELDEVVVVGYGVEKKRDVTGAMTSIGADVIQERPVVNAIDAMQGKAAGVDIITNKRPGEVSSVNIRGNKSLNRPQPVLYVVDGIVLMGDLNDINPNDIESIDILKDASATAIYGSRASNGVVLITTKSGAGGKGTTINYSGSISFDRVKSVTDWASAGNLLDRNRQAFQNHPSGSLYRTSYPDPFEDIRVFGKNDDYMIDAIRQGYQWEDPGTYSQVSMRDASPDEIAKGYPSRVPIYNSDDVSSYDWMDFLTRIGVTQNHNLSIGASNENSNIYFSLGVLDNKGTQVNQSYRRYSTRLSGEVSPKKWIKIGGNLAATYSEQEYGTVFRSGGATGAKDLYGLATGMYPLSQPYDSVGELVIFPGSNSGQPLYNPMIDVDNTDDNRVRSYMQGAIYGEINFTPWLKYRINVGAGVKNYRLGQWRGKQSTLQRSGDPATAWANYKNEQWKEWMVENLIYINKDFGIHGIKATLLQSAQMSRYERIEASANGLLNDAPRWYDLGANLAGTPAGYGTGFSERTLESYMARLNYSLMDKYLLTATIRFDGSSALAPGHKWDNFPSLAFAWKMEEESFMQSISAISQMKLRLGYGVVGNQASVSPYQSTGTLTRYNYVFGTSAAIGYLPYQQPNYDLGWEKQSQFNLGIDYGLFEDRFSGSIELFQSNIDGLIFVQPLPAVIGYTSVITNLGKLQNKGFEFNITSVNIDKRDFSWSTTANVGIIREKIVELVNGKEDMPQNNWFIGQPASVFRTYEVDGIWQNTAEDLEEMQLWLDSSSINFQPGQWKPVDQNGDYRLDDKDLVIRGNRTPKWTGGLTNTFRYKNWTLSSFLYARVGQKYLADLSPGGVSSSGYMSNAPTAKLSEFWSEDNPDAEWPQLTIQSTNGDVARATRVRNGTFFIVRNISLTYDIPNAVLQRLKVKNAEVYAQILNPFIFGGEVVKAGINPEDTNNWSEVNSQGDPVGGTNNNRIIEQSLVFGVRVNL